MAEEHLLIVEDEKKIALLLNDYFVDSGYRVSLLGQGGVVASFVRKNNPDLVLLDINLPELDGFSVCRKIRQFSKVPIIFLTSRAEELDALVGLELGSDDYIRKPFRPREVVARVKAVLRRYLEGAASSQRQIGPLILQEEAHVILLHGKELELTPNEFGLMRTFINRPGKVFTRAELVEQMQGHPYEGYDRTIDTHIKNLRKKLCQVEPNKALIKAVYGVGYKLNEPALKQEQPEY